MKVLVTGAGGFIGGYLAADLAARGFDVCANSRRFNDRWGTGLPAMWARDLNSLGSALPPFGFDAIVHCAAAAGPWCSPEEIQRDNIDATAKLIKAAQNSGIKLFIFLSSLSIYGEIADSVVDETTPIRSDPQEPYGVSKLWGEEALKIADMPSVSLRLPGVIGSSAHGRNWLPSVARKLKAGELIEAFHLDKSFNNAVHVADLAAFIAHLLEHPPADASETFVLGARTSLSVRALIERLAEWLERMPEFREKPPTKPHFILSSVKAQTHGYAPMTMESMIDRYAQEIGCD